MKRTAGALRQKAHALGNAQRTRHALNADTIREMHLAFRRGGRKAIDKVMKQQPAVFLKLLVLLVPRDMRVEHSGGVKAMTEDQIVDAIAAIEAWMAAQKAGEGAKVIEAVPEPVALPAPSRKPRRKRGAEAKASPLLPDEQGETSEPGKPDQEPASKVGGQGIVTQGWGQEREAERTRALTETEGVTLRH